MEKIIPFEQLPNAVTDLSEQVGEIRRLLLENQAQQKLDEPEKLLTVQEAAKFLKLSVTTIYSKVSKGELPVMKRGKRLYFSSTELMAYIKAGRKCSNTELKSEVDTFLSSQKKNKQ